MLRKRRSLLRKVNLRKRRNPKSLRKSPRVLK
jgi:hypothetical protein